MKRYLKTHARLFGALLSVCLIHADALCGEKIIFGTHPIPRLVVDEHHGAFVELTRTIAERANLDIEIVVCPTKRAITYFQHQEFDVLFPGLDVYFSSERPPIQSVECILIKQDFVFTKQGTALLKTIKELEGKRVGITFGYPYTIELTENSLIVFENAPGDENNIKKLLSGRIDAFVVELIAGLQASINVGVVDQIQYDSTSPIAQQNVYYAFQNTEAGKHLEAIVSSTLVGMKNDGTYAKILSQGETALKEFSTNMSVHINCIRQDTVTGEKKNTPQVLQH